MKKFVLIAAVMAVAGVAWAASPTTATAEAGTAPPHRMHGQGGKHGHSQGMKGEHQSGHQNHGQGHGKMQGMGHAEHHAKMGCDESKPGQTEQGHRH